MGRLFELGFKRAALTVLDYGYIESPVSGRNTRAYELKCDCGNEITVPVYKFNRQLVDCGCGAGAKELKIGVYISVKIGIKLKVMELARENGVSEADMYGILIEGGLG
jgi:hypothetical protein